MIEDYNFGRIKIGGQIYTRDVKICAGQVLHPWWRRAGHVVDIEDVQDILEQQPEFLVLGQGSPGRMQCSEALLQELRKRGIQLEEMPSQQAMSRFNELLEQGWPVCAGFHLTC